MQQPQTTRGKVAALRGIGTAQYYAGQHAAAVLSLQEAVREAAGDDRGFALLWLYLAAQRQDGQGRAAIAPYLAEVDASRWPGVLVRHLAGQASADDVLQEARKDKRMERLNLAEAQFYMGQKRLLDGDPAAARTLFERSLEIGATPYVEHMLARVELRRLGETR
jgi:lipoprotein NlpI